MSNVAVQNVPVQKVNGPAKERLPIFEELGKRFEEVRRRAFELFEKRGKEIGREFEDWLTAEREVLGATNAELAEKDKSYELRITLPGFQAKNVNVTVTPAEIVVHAEIKEEKKSEEGKVLWTEFGSKEVYRRFELPNPVDPETAAAKLEAGVLTVEAAKMPAAKEKKITVAAA
jgi:HSP20 family protein